MRNCRIPECPNEVAGNQGQRYCPSHFMEPARRRQAWHEEHREEKAAHQAQRRLEARVYFALVKLERGCADCPPGSWWPPVCLDFDHVRGEKLYDVSCMTRRSWAAIDAEIAKCDVVCSNHHRIRTHERGSA